MGNEQDLFSPEYRIDPGTYATTQTPEEPEPIERQLEKEIRTAVKVYGTGKPRREIIRARVIHD